MRASLTITILLAQTVFASSPITGPWRTFSGDQPAYADPHHDDRQWTQVSQLPTYPEVGATRWFRAMAQFSSQEALLIPPLFGSYQVYLNGRLLGEAVNAFPAPKVFRLPADTPPAATLAIRLHPFPENSRQLLRLSPQFDGLLRSGRHADLTRQAEQAHSSLLEARLPGLII
jgi:hypothetical protein